ncbi:sensor histidine kinase [Luteimonas sp. SDU101]|uniref:sensor histidine kinase n=1 Tax=Luteimonas sp. SDU101 TaxID=3422593 RepID=UPI003EB92BBA
MPAAHAATPDLTPSPDRELYLFALYRVLVASLLALVVFSPAGALIGEKHLPELARTVSVTYLALSVLLLVHSRRAGSALAPHAAAGLSIDITVMLLATHAMPGAGPGIALMLVFNLAAGSLFLSVPWAMTFAAAATLALVAEYAWDRVEQVHAYRPLAEVLMFAVAYFAVAALMRHLGRQMREARRLADQRGAEAANLAEINELVIRRMRIGVILVDGTGRVRMANEAAQSLLRDDSDADRPGMHGQPLAQVAPELAMRLAAWLQGGQQDDSPMACGPEQTDVLPRFARLLATSDSTLIFLDDTSLVSRRAESITLAAMGRFSASLAHEIRNPLAAISYATQLLEESQDLSSSDRRLLQIIHQQCMRTNGIVESVLGLARRERAKPEHIELVGFMRGFIDDYRMIVPEENAQLRLTDGPPRLPVMFDPRHLQQIITSLVNNAVRYGHMPGEMPRIAIHVEGSQRAPVISVLDRGPGIPDSVASQLFRPFFTTSENGTGLGLYIAHELCRANEATLEYVSVPGGGACFRITLPPQHALLQG